jgi:hypothetical protein
VNTPPTGGSLLVVPAQGFALSTAFAVAAMDWQDVDAPLWFQLKYRVVGGNSTAWTALSSPAPVKNINTVSISLPPQVGFNTVVLHRFWL